MADELTASASFKYDDANNSPDGLSVGPILPDVATKVKVHNTILVGTSERAIPLGDVTSPGWAVFVNRDATATIHLLTGTGGVRFASLLPTEFCVTRLGSGVTAPYAIASALTSDLEYMIVNT